VPIEFIGNTFQSFGVTLTELQDVEFK